VQDPAVTQLAWPYKATSTGFARQTPPARSTSDKAGPAGGLVSTVTDLAQWLLARLGRRTEVLPAAALEQLHRPSMLGGISVDQFDEIASLGYGLGCQVESYRGRRIVHHGGNILGYSSDVCIVPGAGIGMAVLTNLDSSYLRLPLMYGILDQLYGDTDAGLGARVHDLQTALLAGHSEARDHRQHAASRAPASRDLSAFSGTYVHPAYGELKIRVDDGVLVPDFHDAGDRLRMVHRGYDAWDLVIVDHEEDCPLVFTQGADGGISGLSVALEAAVAPTVFHRKAEPPTDLLLDAMVGSYRMGPTALAIRRRGDDLVGSSDILGELVLTGASGTTFACPGMPGLSVTADVDQDGTVTRLVVDQVGIFVPEA
jgi:hypothetical protein